MPLSVRSSSLTLLLLAALSGSVTPQPVSGPRDPSGTCDEVKWTLFHLPVARQRPSGDLAELERRSHLEPRNPDLHYHLALRYEEAGENLKAILAYRTALALRQDSEPVVLELASRLFHCRQVGKAVEALARFLEAHPESVPAMRLRSRIHGLDRKYEQALHWARRAQDLDPRNAYGHHLLGLAHQGLLDYQEAIAEFEQAIALAPDLVDPYLELGRLYSGEADSFGLAAERFETAIALGMDQAEIHQQLGAVLLKLGRTKAALAALQRAVERDPEFVQAYFLLGRAYRTLGRAGEAAAALQQFQSLRAAALEKKAAVNQAQTHYEDGIEFFGQDRFQEAYASFQKAIELLPTLDPAYHRLAQIEFLRGNRQAAAARVRSAIDLYPVEGEYYFVLARCLEESDPAAATDAIRRAVDLKPEVGEFHNLLGNLLFVQGDYAGAAQAYREASEREPDNPAFRLNLAAARTRNGERDETPPRPRFRE